MSCCSGNKLADTTGLINSLLSLLGEFLSFDDNGVLGELTLSEYLKEAL